MLAIANYSIKSNYPALLRGNQINEIINYMQFNFVFNTLIYLTKYSSSSVHLKSFKTTFPNLICLRPSKLEQSVVSSLVASGGSRACTPSLPAKDGIHFEAGKITCREKKAAQEGRRPWHQVTGCMCRHSVHAGYNRQCSPWPGKKKACPQQGKFQIACKTRDEPPKRRLIGPNTHKYNGSERLSVTCCAPSLAAPYGVPFCFFFDSIKRKYKVEKLRTVGEKLQLAQRRVNTGLYSGEYCVSIHVIFLAC